MYSSTTVTNYCILPVSDRAVQGINAYLGRKERKKLFAPDKTGLSVSSSLNAVALRNGAQILK